MIKRGTARRLGIKRPTETVDFRKIGVSVAEVAAAWPATRERLRAALGFSR